MAAKKLVYTMLLLALIAFKVSSAAIHIHLHHDHDEGHKDHCELCEIVLEFNKSEFSSNVEIVFDKDVEITAFNASKEGYSSIFLVTNTDRTLFGRPPPLMA